MLVIGGVLTGFDASFASTDNLTYAAQQTKGAQPLKLVVGKSTIVDVPVPIKRASLANPDIADAIVLSPKQLYVTGQRLWDDEFDPYGEKTIRSLRSLISMWAWTSAACKVSSLSSCRTSRISK